MEPFQARHELIAFASVGIEMKAHQASAVVAVALLLGGSTLIGAFGAEPAAPQQNSEPAESKSQNPEPPDPKAQDSNAEGSKSDADAARKAVRARMARCKAHPEICRQQQQPAPPK